MQITVSAKTKQCEITANKGVKEHFFVTFAILIFQKSIKLQSIALN